MPKRSALARLSLGDKAAITFVVLAAALACVAISTDAADGWASNLAAEALGIAATVAIVERVFRAEERRRRAPRVEPALFLMGNEFRVFVEYVAQDYATTYREGLISRDAFALLDEWLLRDEQGSADAPHTFLDPWDPKRPQHTLREHGWDFVQWVSEAEHDERELLEPDLVAAVGQLRASRASSRRALGAARHFGGPQELVDHFEQHSFRILVARVRAFGEVLMKYAGPHFFMLSADAIEIAERVREERFGLSGAADSPSPGP